jgi:hypothetical protein
VRSGGIPKINSPGNEMDYGGTCSGTCVWTIVLRFAAPCNNDVSVKYCKKAL